MIVASLLLHDKISESSTSTRNNNARTLDATRLRVCVCAYSLVWVPFTITMGSPCPAMYTTDQIHRRHTNTYCREFAHKLMERILLSNPLLNANVISCGDEGSWVCIWDRQRWKKRERATQKGKLHRSLADAIFMLSPFLCVVAGIFPFALCLFFFLSLSFLYLVLYTTQLTFTYTMCAPDGSAIGLASNFTLESRHARNILNILAKFARRNEIEAKSL